uniref:Uroporphyrinogen decarboxylase n=1 Tax=Craspedostauros australis TaxID=1486917 RepID=A0A7R9WRD9_9STRA|mmetsp:Transcript_17184/g.47583  ORF Transcript_17184/g.47583 Transcript_17184/m.47583 type:complete len:458 (+) Transcript_17184:95-1468(+)|eukprot:CAMPEP_0198111344 /NCGR_PEP_ID=MMETSP1442-20131203/3304_1 /TAXON_ID= /ORGANISM="Craspedostauros australis, Strain CCMP3328" /LENGTH=457 /DNA_ID=CAMNT_0043767727 /DNA_START=121 /DNA_END=1494 /DNA_ORIENTATION=+
MKISAAAFLLLLPCAADAFVAPQSPTAFTQRGRHLSGAATAAEDLELTRKIILEGMSGNAVAASSESSDKLFEINFDKDRKSEYKTHPRPANDLMIRAALGEPVEKTPLWLFRQAGRHLPEYQSYKEETGRNFLDLLAYPDSVAECTMQPLRRYDVDAAILFSDILVIAEALGIEVTMPGGVGILVPNPLKAPEDVAARIPSLDDITPAFVEDKLGHVFEAVRQIRSQMEAEDKSIPLIGFSAAPWTLLFYMVGGSSKKNTELGMKWLQEHPEESTTLLQTLTKIVVEYMSAQVEQGAHMLQIFEAMGMMIDEENFYKFAMPCLEQIEAELKVRFPDVPLMVFSRGASFANAELAKRGFDVITIDGEVDRATARAVIGDDVTLQGNYDPREMIDDGSKTPETVRQTAKEMLEVLGPEKLIANLGEGLGGKESPALVKVFVDAIHEESEIMISAGKKD